MPVKKAKKPRKKLTKAMLDRHAELAVCQLAQAIVGGNIRDKGGATYGNETEKTLSNWVIKLHNNAETLRASLLIITCIAKLNPALRSSLAKDLLKEAKIYLDHPLDSDLSNINAVLTKIQRKAKKG